MEIHVGDYHADTDACLLLGSIIGTDFAGNSNATIAAFYQRFFTALNNGEAISIKYL